MVAMTYRCACRGMRRLLDFHSNEVGEKDRVRKDLQDVRTTEIFIDRNVEDYLEAKRTTYFVQPFPNTS
jgi:hypothetical protein